MAPVSGLGPPGLLRLCVVFHESEALGAGRSILNCLPELQGLGWTATGWFPGDGDLVDEAADRLAARIVEQKPIAYSARGWRADPGVLPRAARTTPYLRAFRRALLSNRPHVVHANTLRSLPEATVARTLGIPVVVQVHELPEEGAKATVTLRWAARVADVLVAVSNAVAARLRPHAGRTPLITVHNGIQPYSTERRPEPGLVGTIGTVAWTKGTDVFLEAAEIALRRNAGLRFEHAGPRGLDNDVEFGRRADALARRPSVAEGVQMLGPQPAGDLLQRWELFVLPSRQDSFPLVVLEAMSAGLPVIASAVGGVPEQVAHLESGILVASESPTELSDWILRLHEDAELREKLGGAAAVRVREDFTPARQALGLHRAYLAALNLRHAPPPVRRATVEAL
jgi:glycosyltransferase involved in cell wall biosynthesis